MDSKELAELIMKAIKPTRDQLVALQTAHTVALLSIARHAGVHQPVANELLAIVGQDAKAAEPRFTDLTLAQLQDLAQRLQQTPTHR